MTLENLKKRLETEKDPSKLKLLKERISNRMKKLGIVPEQPKPVTKKKEKKEDAESPA